MSIRQAYTQTLEDSSDMEPSAYAKEQTQHRENVNTDLLALFTQSGNAYQKIVDESQEWLKTSEKEVNTVVFEEAHDEFVTAVLYTQQEPQVIQQILTGTETKTEEAEQKQEI